MAVFLLGKLLDLDYFSVNIVMCSFVGVGGLIKRMAEDRCLPQFLLARYVVDTL